MAIVSLDQVKAQLNQTLDLDDVLITQKIGAAQDHLEHLLGFKIDATTYPDVGGVTFPATVPPALAECVCQLAAHWYENREAVLVGVNAQALPIGVDDVVREFRNWSWAD